MDSRDGEGGAEQDEEEEPFHGTELVAIMGLFLPPPASLI
jgi:hypothetical protein